MHCQPLLLSLLFLTICTGCGSSVYRPAQAAGFALDPATEIDDDDIAKAFTARPQLPEEVHVSYFSFDDKRSPALAKTVAASSKVTGSYEIPSLLVTGKGRLDDVPTYPPPAPQPLSMKKLRLLAARAHSDVLVIFDYGHRITSQPNGLVATAVLLIPTFFVPMADYEVESYLDTYVIDVKNGYLYAHISSKASDLETYESLFSEVDEKILEEQWTRLEQETRAKLDKVLADPELRLPAKTKVARDSEEG